MWLLDARTYQLVWHLDSDAFQKGYAILSHTWGEQEVTFADIQDREKARTMHGFRKIEYTCRQALEDGHAYAWVDTCCIDKTSSAELSEAINSMFHWYRNAMICYAYLPDVDPAEADSVFDEHFKNSRWFTRGWTLQELLAPKHIHFFGSDWTSFGTKDSLHEDLICITGIEKAYLVGGTSLALASVAKKMSWAAGRQTSRTEDRAYSLMGIFSVNMPLLYGEGHKAFQRLQEEIIRTTADQSVLLWSLTDYSTQSLEAMAGLRNMNSHGGPYAGDNEQRQLLAESPECFAKCGDVEWYHAASAYPFDVTNAGLRLTMPTSYRDADRYMYLVLNCHYSDDRWSPIGLPVFQNQDVFLRDHTAIQAVRKVDAESCQFPTFSPAKLHSNFQSLLLTGTRKDGQSESSDFGRRSTHGCLCVDWEKTYNWKLVPSTPTALERSDWCSNDTWATTLKDKGQIGWWLPEFKAYIVMTVHVSYSSFSQAYVCHLTKASRKPSKLDMEHHHCPYCVTEVTSKASTTDVVSLRIEARDATASQLAAEAEGRSRNLEIEPGTFIEVSMTLRLQNGMLACFVQLSSKDEDDFHLPFRSSR